MRMHILRGLLGVLCLGLVLTSCGKDNPKSPANVTITNAQAARVGDALAQQVNLLTQAFNVNTLLNPFAIGKVGPIDVRFPVIFADSCGTVSGDSLDSDGDGVPNNLTITFNPCVVASDSFTVEISGSLSIQDIGTNRGYSSTFTNLRLQGTQTVGGTDFFSLTVNGTQGVSADQTNATLNEALSVAIAGSESGVPFGGSIAQNWTVGFDAASGDSIALDGDLASGQFSINGNTAWVFNTDSFSLRISTQSPLAFDSSCAQSGDFPFSGGELRARVEGNEAGAFVRIVYTACGVPPTITLVPTS